MRVSPSGKATASQAVIVGSNPTTRFCYRERICYSKRTPHEKQIRNGDHWSTGGRLRIPRLSPSRSLVPQQSPFPNIVYDHALIGMFVEHAT